MDLSELSEKIVEALRARNFEGETYAQMEKVSGVSGSYIHSLANHQCDPIKMSLEKFLALFPSARIELAPACIPDDPAAVQDLSCVPRSEYQDLRDRYQDLRDRYQDLRDELLNLKSRPPCVLDGPGPRAPYHVAPSTSSPSTK